MMAAFKISLFASNFLLFVLFLYFHNLTTKTINETCYSWEDCGIHSWPPIKFPFKLRGEDKSERCGYKGTGFEVFCGGEAKNRTLITLPYSGDFVVKRISYTDRKLWINDLHNCLPKRYINRKTGLSLEGSPYQTRNDFKQVNFYKCITLQFIKHKNWMPIQCLSDDNSTIIAKASYFTQADHGCEKISSTLVPLIVDGGVEEEFRLAPEQLFGDIELQWTTPSCNYLHCEEYIIIKYTLGLCLAIAGILVFAKVYGAILRRVR